MDRKPPIQLPGCYKDFNKALEIDSSYYFAYVNRGWIKAEIDKNDQGAIGDYNRAIALNNNNGYAYYVRGRAKIRLGQTDEGCKDIYRSRELKYEDPQHHYNPCK